MSTIAAALLLMVNPASKAGDGGNLGRIGAWGRCSE